MARVMQEARTRGVASVYAYVRADNKVTNCNSNSNYSSNYLPFSSSGCSASEPQVWSVPCWGVSSGPQPCHHGENIPQHCTASIVPEYYDQLVRETCIENYNYCLIHTCYCALTPPDRTMALLQLLPDTS